MSGEAKFEFETWKTVADLGSGLLLQEKYKVSDKGNTRLITQVEHMSVSVMRPISRSGTNPYTGEEIDIAPDRRIIHVSELDDVQVSEVAMQKLSDLSCAGDFKERES